MTGQLSLWDLFLTYPDINTVPEQEAVKMVGEAIGITFMYNDRFECWEARKGPLKLSLRYGRFAKGVNDERLFLGTGYDRGPDGGSRPCDGIGEAIKWFKSKMGAL